VTALRARRPRRHRRPLSAREKDRSQNLSTRNPKQPLHCPLLHPRSRCRRECLGEPPREREETCPRECGGTACEHGCQAAGGHWCGGRTVRGGTRAQSRPLALPRPPGRALHAWPCPGMQCPAVRGRAQSPPEPAEPRAVILLRSPSLVPAACSQALPWDSVPPPLVLRPPP